MIPLWFVITKMFMAIHWPSFILIIIIYTIYKNWNITVSRISVTSHCEDQKLNLQFGYARDTLNEQGREWQKQQKPAAAEGQRRNERAGQRRRGRGNGSGERMNVSFAVWWLNACVKVGVKILSRIRILVPAAISGSELEPFDWAKQKAGRHRRLQLKHAAKVIGRRSRRTIGIIVHGFFRFLVRLQKEKCTRVEPRVNKIRPKTLGKCKQSVSTATISDFQRVCQLFTSIKHSHNKRIRTDD